MTNRVAQLKALSKKRLKDVVYTYSILQLSSNIGGFTGTLQCS